MRWPRFAEPRIGVSAPPPTSCRSWHPTKRRPSALAAAEIKLSLATLEYARHARGGRLDPAQVSRSFDQKPSLPDPKEVMRAVAGTETPGTYLVGLHPKHPQFERLRQALLKAPAGGARPAPTAEPVLELPNGPTLKPGMEHPHVAFLRQRLGVPARAGARDVYDEPLAEAVMAFQRQKGIRPDGVVSPRTRAALNGGSARPAEPSPSSDMQHIIANMERWRWLPEDLGKLYVWDNVPEFMTRVVKSGRTIASGQDHCRQARDADRDVLCQHALRRLRPGMGGP